MKNVAHRWRAFWMSRAKKARLARKKSVLSQVVLNPALVRKGLGHHLYKRIPQPWERPDYLVTEKRLELLNAKLIADLAAKRPESRELLDEMGELADIQLKRLSKTEPDSIYFREFTRRAAKYALMQVETERGKLYRSSVLEKIAHELSTRPWLYQVEDVRPFLVKLLGKQGALDFLYYYRQRYRDFSLREWKLPHGSVPDEHS